MCSRGNRREFYSAGQDWIRSLPHPRASFRAGLSRVRLLSSLLSLHLVQNMFQSKDERSLPSSTQFIATWSPRRDRGGAVAVSPTLPTRQPVQLVELVVDHARGLTAGLISVACIHRQPHLLHSLLAVTSRPLFFYPAPVPGNSKKVPDTLPHETAARIYPTETQPGRGARSGFFGV